MVALALMPHSRSDSTSVVGGMFLLSRCDSCGTCLKALTAGECPGAITTSCGRAMERGDLCFGTDACGASATLGNCQWGNGVYEALHCSDAQPGKLYLTITVDGEPVNDCAMLAQYCDSGLPAKYTELLRSSCPASCGTCANATEHQDRRASCRERV